MIGFASDPAKRAEGQIYEMTLYDDSYCVKFDESKTVYLDNRHVKILSVMNSVTYMSSFNIVHILCNPFGTSYARTIDFMFDFVVQDYATIGSDKCVAISRDGWIGVFFEDSDLQVFPSNSFQLELDDEEYADCIVGDQSSSLICVAVSKNGKATRLIFCEVIGQMEIFLVQSSTFYFSSSNYCKRPNAIKMLSTDFAYCGDCVIIAFEGGNNAGMFCITANSGGQIINEKNYMASVFEGEFVAYNCHQYSEVWTVDTQGNIKRRSKEQILGIKPLFDRDSPILSEDEQDVQDDTYQSPRGEYSHATVAAPSLGIRGKISKFSRMGSGATAMDRDSEQDYEDQQSQVKLRSKNHTYPAYKIEEGLFTDQIAGIREEEEFEEDLVYNSHEGDYKEYDDYDYGLE